MKKKIEPQPIGVGDFGSIYDQFRDKATGLLVDEKKKWVVTSYDNNVPKSDKKSASTPTTPESDEGGRAVASDAIS